MTTQLDGSIGAKKESTYGTAVVVDQFVEYLADGTSFTYDPSYVERKGARIGVPFDVESAAPLEKLEVGAKINLEAPLKGLGLFLESALGTVTNTAVPSATGAFQQVHTPSTTDPDASYTIQWAAAPLGGGAVAPHTFVGMQCSTLEISFKAGAVVEIASEWVGKDMLTATAYATPTYPALQDLFICTQGSIALGSGAVAPATTTALASGGTAVANVIEGSIKIDNGLDGVTPTLGAGGKRHRRAALGKRVITGSVTVEFDSTTFRDAQIARSAMGLLVTFTHSTTIGTGTPVAPVLQVAIPRLKFDKTELPSMSNGINQQKIDFKAFYDGTNAPIQFVYRTTDTTP